MPLVPGSDLGPYRIVEKVGQGGMATVYKAYHAALSRFVALKILPAQLASDPQFQSRFREEAVAVAGLRHNNIMAVYDYGEVEGITFIVNEFIDGGTFDQQMGAVLPLSYVIDILGPIAGALDYAHARGVIHRDVKPSNILVSREGRPLLGDFGLARMMMPERDLTQTGMILGTPSYMAPEQGQGEPVRESDIYSLGIIAYQALTGRVPFQAATPMAVIIAAQTDPLPMPRSINPDIPASVEAALLKCLARVPGDRYPTGEAFIRALSRARDASEETVATPAPAMDPQATIVDAGGAPPAAPSRRGRTRPAEPPPPIVAPPAAPGAPAPRSRTPLLVGIIGGAALLLLLLVGGGVYAAIALTSSHPTPTAGEGSSSGGKGMSLDNAKKAAADAGYPQCNSQSYEPNNTLHVLICDPAGGGRGQRAFFYTDKFVGNDADDASGKLDFGAQTDTNVTITYTLWKAADPECCPTGGQQNVRFNWDGSKLEAQDPVPSSDSSQDGSRR